MKSNFPETASLQGNCDGKQVIKVLSYNITEYMQL